MFFLENITAVNCARLHKIKEIGEKRKKQVDTVAQVRVKELKTMKQMIELTAKGNKADVIHLYNSLIYLFFYFLFASIRLS